MSIKTKELKKIEKEIGKLRLYWGKEINQFASLRRKQEKSNPIYLWLECQAKKTQTIELCKKFEDAEKDKVEKLKECVINNNTIRYEKRKHFIEKIDKIFGDEK